jgi:hypothetical protein
MPIRFRCAYCNQLMGIARRKSGTVVRCPKCAGEVIVPSVQEPQVANVQSGFNQVFEAPDFDREFANLPAPPAPAAPAANPLMPPPAYGHPPLLETQSHVESPSASSIVEALPEPRSLRRPGVFLTTPMLFGAGSLLLLAIGVTFLLGFFLGRATLP